MITIPKHELILFKTISDNVNSGIVVTDLSWNVIYVNEYFADIHGYKPPELLGRNLDILHNREQLLSPIYIRIKKALEEQGKFNALEIWSVRKNGTVFPILQNGMIIELIPDQPKHIVISAIEISKRKLLYDRERRRYQEIKLLKKAGEIFICTHSVDQVMSTLLNRIRRIFGILGCSIWLKDPKSDNLVCEVATGVKKELVQGWVLEPGQGLAGWVVKNGKSLIVPDATKDRRHDNRVAAKINKKIRSVITVPLKRKDDVLGVIQLVDGVTNKFNKSDLLVLETLALSAAIAIENAILYGRLNSKK